jgi:transaldolase / glucose-6-phosphate isomerase
VAHDPTDRLGPLAEGAAAVTAQLVEADAVRRMWDGDHTLWRDDPTEIADRLGWLHVVEDVRADLDDLRGRCARLIDGVEHVVVMGMGGSSLFPEVLAATFGPQVGHPRLVVLDSTSPTAVAAVGEACPPERTLHLAASKSGSTIETRSHLEWAWWRAGGDGPFAVITDPGSELAALARDRAFLDVFENREDIGGRYSAMSLFGIVPALLAGVDVEGLLEGATEALVACGPGADPAANPGLALAAAMAAGVRAGRDKLTVVLPDEVASFGLWLEQLVAESLGKDGTGIVPVVGETLGAPDVYGDDRLFATAGADPSGPELAALAAAGHPVIGVAGLGDLRAGDVVDARWLGRAVVVCEVATALAGAALGVQPFDQPDVAAAKAATNRVLDGDAGRGLDPTPVADLLATLQPGDHLALQAFVDPASPVLGDLAQARAVLRDRHRVATSLGIGPRFLHSTGQLHKGGPPSAVCLQIVEDPEGEIDIPGRSFGFGHLLRAQADGDLITLRERGIRAARVRPDDLREVVW